MLFAKHEVTLNFTEMKATLGYLCSSTSWGGLEMNHLRNAFWMQNRGHCVLILCVEGSPLAQHAVEMMLKVIHIKKHRKYYDFKNARSLTRIIKDKSITHLIIRSNEDVSISAAVKSKLGRRLHTSYFMEMQIGVKKTNLLHTLRFRYIDLWSCPLNWLKEQVEKLTNFHNKLVVIPSGLNLEQFSRLPEKSDSRSELELPNNVFIFGLIGRFDRQKGQLLLLDAMTKSKHSNYSVVLLGEPTLNEGDIYYNQMTAIIDEKSLNERVHIRPFRKDAEVFYNAIDWLVMATEAETFGMVTIEALACGRPVLGSNAGGTPEILQNEKGGRLFHTLDSTDLALQIDHILDNSDHYNSDELKQMAKAYNHIDVCKKVEKALGLVE